ncbi:MAG: virulence factor [Bosea sp. (in: a-proteobacteria)]
MPDLTILYWRDIPAQVIARAGRSAARRELSRRFTEAIDMAAMKSGAKDSDAYLAEWRRGAAVPCSADLEAEATRLMAELEAAYDAIRLKALALNGGHEAT